MGTGNARARGPEIYDFTFCRGKDAAGLRKDSSVPRAQPEVDRRGRRSVHIRCACRASRADVRSVATSVYRRPPARMRAAGSVRDIAPPGGGILFPEKAERP